MSTKPFAEEDSAERVEGDAAPPAAERTGPCQGMTPVCALVMALAAGALVYRFLIRPRLARQAEEAKDGAPEVPVT
jgi:hypothetical protein